MSVRKSFATFCFVFAFLTHRLVANTQTQADVQLNLTAPVSQSTQKGPSQNKRPNASSSEKKEDSFEHVAMANNEATSHDATRLSKKDRRLRKRKSKTTRHTMSTMSYEELTQAKNRKLEENNIELAIKYAEKMLPVCKDMHELKDLTIELADLYFQNGDLEKAGKLYNEFIKLYPGYDKIEHAQHKAILCAFYSMLDAEHDQTKTKETLELTKKFLDRSDVFTIYCDEVTKIQKQCYTRLVENEKIILEYYLNRESFKSAQNRVDGLRKDFIEIMPNLEADLLSYEIIIAEKQKNVELALQKKQQLTQNFPLHGAIITTAQAERKIDFSQKF